MSKAESSPVGESPVLQYATRGGTVRSGLLIAAGVVLLLCAVVGVLAILAVLLSMRSDEVAWQAVACALGVMMLLTGLALVAGLALLRPTPAGWYRARWASLLSVGVAWLAIVAMVIDWHWRIGPGIQDGLGAAGDLFALLVLCLMSSGVFWFYLALAGLLGRPAALAHFGRGSAASPKWGRLPLAIAAFLWLCAVVIGWICVLSS